MVVLRIIGDEWGWDDRIALAVPPQRTFAMCVPLLVPKLGVAAWGGLALYKTEGRPPRYCRPTTPVDMTSSCRRERMRDGAVLWVRVAPSLAQQERDRVFQKSLEEWRGKKGLKGVAADGSDVKRFIEELNSHLNSMDAANVSTEEQEARQIIEGEEHRSFSFLTSTYREKENLQREEETKRRELETLCMVTCERCFRDFWIFLAGERLAEMTALEERSRGLLQEEENRAFETLKRLISEDLYAPAERADPGILDVKPAIDEKSRQTREQFKGENYDPTPVLLCIHAELQKLLELIEQMHCEGSKVLQQRQATTASDEALCLLARLQHCVRSLLSAIHNDETWRSGSFSSSLLPELLNLERVKEAVEQQQCLLAALVQEYRDVKVGLSGDLQLDGLGRVLNAVHAAQLDLCRYLDFLREELSLVSPLQRDMVGKDALTCGAMARVSLKSVEPDRPETSQCSPGCASGTLLGTAKVFFQMNFFGTGIAGVHADTYNILSTFVSQCTELLCVRTQGSEEEAVKDFLRDLLLQSGSLQTAVDELCWTCNVVSHPMRGLFFHVTEFYAPHLCVVVDLMLHMYLGREAELLLWIRPELTGQGNFASGLTEDGLTYYYHTAADVSQWLQPVALAEG